MLWLFLLACTLGVFVLEGIFLSYPDPFAGFIKKSIFGEVQEKKVIDKSQLLPEKHAENEAPKKLHDAYKQSLDKLPLVEAEKSKLSGKYRVDIEAGIEVPIMVMIENHPDARAQQSGLDKASIVFEALAEGGITRFLAIFSPSDIEKIGPVRSARPYFVDWAEEFGGIYVHAGGSDPAFAQIARSKKILDINENDKEFWRDKDYLRPHNLFSNMSKILAFQKEQKWKTEMPNEYIQFDLELPSEGKRRKIQELTLHFSTASYTVKYVYSELEDKFKRYHGTKSHHDIKVDNIIVLFTSYYPYDDKGRLSLKTVGEGTAWFFERGYFFQGTWQKKSKNEKTRFYIDQEQGREMTFKPGNTWIEVIDDEKKLIVK